MHRRPIPSLGVTEANCQRLTRLLRDFRRACDIIWDFIIEGIVRPGPLDGSDQGLPHFHVTEYGREKIKGGPALPYDPDGYLSGSLKLFPTSTK